MEDRSDHCTDRCVGHICKDVGDGGCKINVGFDIDGVGGCNNADVAKQARIEGIEKHVRTGGNASYSSAAAGGGKTLHAFSVADRVRRNSIVPRRADGPRYCFINQLSI